jgi:hypothetical protein
MEQRRTTDEEMGTMPLGVQGQGSVVAVRGPAGAIEWGVMGDLVYLLIVFVMFALAAGYARISTRL